MLSGLDMPSADGREQRGGGQLEQVSLHMHAVTMPVSLASEFFCGILKIHSSSRQDPFIFSNDMAFFSSCRVIKALSCLA